MLKKLVSILMCYSALAVMLGHDFTIHKHHHDFEQKDTSHHDDHKRHHHDNNTDDNDAENESNDWKHFFSSLHHGSEGFTFLINYDISNNFLNQDTSFSLIRISNFHFKQVIIEVRQNAPPFIAAYYNSQIFLPSGLRAPPVFIV